MKKIIFTISIALTTTLCVAQEKIINFNQIPSTAQSFVNENFANYSVVKVVQDVESDKTTYEIKLSNGAKLEFCKNGDWKKIDYKNKAIETKLIPQEIVNYIDKIQTSAKVVEIEREKNGYEIKLDNNTEITFDSNFNVIKIDD